MDWIVQWLLKERTYSRQLSLLLLLGLGYLTYVDKTESLEIWIGWVFTFTLFAFGLKQSSVDNLLQRIKPT